MTTYNVGDTVKIGEWIDIVDDTRPTGSGIEQVVYFDESPWLYGSQLDSMGAVIVPKPIEWQVGDYVRALSSGQVFRWNANPGTFAAGGSQHTRDQIETGLRRGT